VQSPASPQHRRIYSGALGHTRNSSIAADPGGKTGDHPWREDPVSGIFPDIDWIRMVVMRLALDGGMPFDYQEWPGLP